MALFPSTLVVVVGVLLVAPFPVGAVRLHVDANLKDATNTTTPATGQWMYADKTQFPWKWSNALTLEEMVTELEARSSTDKKRDVVVKVYGKQTTCRTVGDVRTLFDKVPVHYDMSQSSTYLNSLRKMLGVGYSHTLCGKSKDFCETATGVFDSTWKLSYDAVVADLETIPERFGSKQIVKGNDLGEFILNNKLWKHDPYLKAIALGLDVESHSWVRPILAKILGHDSPAWNNERIRAMVQKFFQGRTTIDSAKDPYILLAKVLHSITLGMEISDERAEEFQAWQAKLPVFVVLPDGLVSGIGGKITKQEGDNLRKKRAELLVEYKAKIREDYNSNNQERPVRQLFEQLGLPLDDKHVHLLAHGMLDAMAFAGGLSVPGMMKVGLAVLKSDASELTYEQQALTGPDDVDKLVWEVIRRYPPVVAFSYWNDDETARSALGLGMALRDPKKWDEPMAFKLRDLADYKAAATVAWAQQANGKTPGPNSRGCPGQTLSLVIATEFFEAFREQQGEWSITTPAVHFQDYAPWITKDFVMSKRFQGAHPPPQFLEQLFKF